MMGHFYDFENPVIKNCQSKTFEKFYDLLIPSFCYVVQKF